MIEFYKKNMVIQWLVAIAMLLTIFAIFTLWIKLLIKSYIAFLLIFLIVPILQFLITPFFRLIGLYKYISPMMAYITLNGRKCDLHNGSSFDYLIVMMSPYVGIKLRHNILEYYCEGLLELIRQIENQKLPSDIIIRGSSYFCSERTVEKLGFELSKTNIFVKLNFILNYIDLIWMYSLSRGKLTFPNLKNIKTATITGSRLVNKKEKILKIKAYFNRNSK
jgi:hypothetical protein